MTDMEAVKARYPDAIAFQWTGYWRIYKTPEIMKGGGENLISGAYSTEDQAWAGAREIIGEKLAEGSTKS